MAQLQILPPKINTGGEIGKSAGSGLQRGLEAGMQNEYQYSRDTSRLNQVFGEMQKEGQSPMQILQGLAKASLINPNLERSLGPIFQELMKTSSAQQTPGAIGSTLGGQQSQTPGTQRQQQPMQDTRMGQGNQRELMLQGGAQERLLETPMELKDVPRVTKNASQVDDESYKFIQELRPDLLNAQTPFGSTVPTFDFMQKSDLRRDEEAGMREQMIAKGIRPEVQDQTIEKVRNDIKNKWNENLQFYKLDENAIKANNDKWDVVRKNALDPQQGRLLPYVNKYKDAPQYKEDVTNKYFQYAGQQPTNYTPEQIHDNAMQLLQRDLNQIDALKSGYEAPVIHDVKSMKDFGDSYREAVMPLIQKGYANAVKEDALANKDLGLEEYHQIIYGPQTNKDLLNSIHSVKSPKEASNVVSGGQIQRSRNKNFPEERQKYVQELSNKLKKIGPNDDLVLMRAMVLDNGGTIKDFTEALNTSGAKLSPFQERQLQEVQLPRQPPISEIFSPGSWKSWVNYIRGKK